MNHTPSSASPSFWSLSEGGEFPRSRWAGGTSNLSNIGKFSHTNCLTKFDFLGKFFQMPDGESYKYPDPDQLQINEADLKLKFAEYYEAVKSRFSLLDIFVIVPAWLPVFLSDFNEFYGIPGHVLVGSYSALIGLASLWWILRIRFSIGRFISGYVKWFGSGWEKYETDPAERVNDIKKESREVFSPMQGKNGFNSRKVYDTPKKIT